ncbi:MAG: hypothetical protein EBX40_05300, partial [Gammaproteobacteria bacterium]|nr:hypothetical protein [Gammaproteobacteria bacterium]
TTLQLEARADEFELAAAQVHIAAFQEVLETRESAADQTLKLIKLYNGENEPLSEETLESLKKGKKSAEAARNGALRGVLMTGLVLGTFAASLAFPIAYVATITAIFTVTSVVGLGFLSYDVHQQRKKIEALEAEIAAISAKDPTGESSTIQTQLSEKQQELKQAQTVLKGQLKSLALNSLCVGLLIAGAVCAVLAPPVGAALLTAGFATFLCMIGVPAAQSIKARFNKPAPRDATTLFPQAEVKSGSPEVKKDLSRNPDAESKSNTP